MKARGFAAIIAVAGALTVPSTASAWPTCDPLTGHYTDLGRSFFNALSHMQRRKTGAAHVALLGFFNHVDHMIPMLADSAMLEPLKALSSMRKDALAMSGKGLPTIELVTDLGRLWAEIQLRANELAMVQCTGEADHR